MIHIQKEHGDEITEKARGQLPVTDADIARIPAILKDYDGVRFDLRSNGDRPVIAYVKRINDGILLYTEEVHNKRHDLSALALRKYPATLDAIELLNNARQNVLNDNGHTLSIGKAPDRINSEFKQFYQNNRGAYSPSENTITLLKNADLSTFLHELGRAFLSMDSQFASQVLARGATTDGEKQILADMKTLLDWFGIEGELPDQLAAWNAMSVEEQRASHEKMAEAFEAYLFEGKAPSLDLQPIFQRFRAWLTNVYRNLSKYLSDAGETLTPEVRAVFDSMLATADQIKTAQQARGIAPLFKSADEAGMSPDEFAKYQQDSVTSSQDAISA